MLNGWRGGRWELVLTSKIAGVAQTSHARTERNFQKVAKFVFMLQLQKLISMFFAGQLMYEVYIASTEFTLNERELMPLPMLTEVKTYNCIDSPSTSAAVSRALRANKVQVCWKGSSVRCSRPSRIWPSAYASQLDQMAESSVNLRARPRCDSM